MSILEAKLSTIPGLDDVQAAQYEPPSGMAAAGVGPSSQAPPTTSTSTGPPPLPGDASSGNEPLPPPQGKELILY